MTSTQWFSTEGLPQHNAFESAFLEQLAARAEAWDTDVMSLHTYGETISGQVVVGIKVPGLSGRLTTLWVRCVADEHGPPLLEGSWGDHELVADHYGADPLRDLTVRGVPLSAESAADLAARWCERHLRMDIYREEWVRGRWTRRDAIGREPEKRKRGSPLRTVLERTNGRATGDHLA